MLSPTEPETDLDGEHLVAGVQLGDYVIEALLGAGGFARVYRARHVTLGTEVAIKVLSRALALDPHAMVRFIREAQAATRISHPNVVRVLGFGRHEDGRAFQVMDLVDGIPLDRHLENVGRVSVAEALELLAGIVAGLEAAHASGIVHRDLKPSNVLLAGSGDRRSPKLADFGIAKAIEGDVDPRLTQTGVTLGTPIYMSPEQALGRRVTDASDVYSFGVVAFELLTGRVPFTAETPFETMMLHVQTEPPVASAVAPELGSSFDAVLARLLAKQAEARPALAEAMRELRSAVLVPRGKVPTRRIAISIAVGAVLVTCAALCWTTASRAPTRASPPVRLPVEAPLSSTRPASMSPAPPTLAPTPRDDVPVVPTKLQATPGRGAPRNRARPDAKPAPDSFEAPPGYQ